MTHQQGRRAHTRASLLRKGTWEALGHPAPNPPHCPHSLPWLCSVAPAPLPLLPRREPSLVQTHTPPREQLELPIPVESSGHSQQRKTPPPTASTRPESLRLKIRTTFRTLRATVKPEGNNAFNVTIVDAPHLRDHPLGAIRPRLGRVALRPCSPGHAPTRRTELS